MKPDALILGIETSCDDSAAAVVRGGREVLVNRIATQVPCHQKFGGVVPEVASRKHLEAIAPLVRETLAEAGLGLTDLDGLAVTYGPGLVGSLLVGVSFAKALAYALGLPLAGVHHIEGHIFANFLAHPGVEPPLVCLTVSGGHTEIYYMPQIAEYELLGRTRDDAAGEAFDKVARVLGLGYPGGPPIERLSSSGDHNSVALPRGLAGEQTLDFSFSGLKTAALNHINQIRQTRGELNEAEKADLAASFQWAVVDVLAERAVKAAASRGVRTLLVSGGVAANGLLRETLTARAADRGITAHFPPRVLCTDNAAMIAAAGYHHLRRGVRSDLSLNAVPSLPLTS